MKKAIIEYNGNTAVAVVIDGIRLAVDEDEIEEGRFPASNKDLNSKVTRIISEIAYYFNVTDEMEGQIFQLCKI